VRTALLLLCVIAATPLSARPQRTGHYADQAAGSVTSSINCETVRSYVLEIGLVQARALARANGMTPLQEWRATQCLDKRDR
jgi:hypothetical protein